MNKVRLNAAVNIKETGKFIVAVLIALLLIYIMAINGQTSLELKPDKIKHISCVKIKMHLLGLEKVRELKRYRYESIEAYFRMNCGDALAEEIGENKSLYYNLANYSCKPIPCPCKDIGNGRVFCPYCMTINCTPQEVIVPQVSESYERGYAIQQGI